MAVQKKGTLIDPCELPFSFTATDVIRSNMQRVIDHSKSLGLSDDDFWSCICNIQNPRVRLNLQQQSPSLIWNAAETQLRNATLELMDIKEFEADCFFSNEETNQLEPVYKEGVRLIRSVFPTTYSNIERLIKYILLAKREGYEGGSVSSCIGLIWMAPKLDWKPINWADNIVHEYIHNAIFLEDMVNTIFPYSSGAMDEPDGLAMSAIRQTRRGYDKSYHSAFVSHGLIQFYLKLNDFDYARRMLPPLLICLEDLSKNQKYLSPNGVEHLDKLIRETLNVAKLVDELIYCPKAIYKSHIAPIC